SPIREDARILGQCAESFEEERRHVAPADALSGSVRQRALSCRVPHRSWQLVLPGDRIRHDDARTHVQRKVRVYRLREETNVVDASIDRQPAVPGIKGGKLVRPEAEHWDAEHLEQFEYARQVTHDRAYCTER